jgi:hypothetical protein
MLVEMAWFRRNCLVGMLHARFFAAKRGFSFEINIRRQIVDVGIAHNRASAGRHWDHCGAPTRSKAARAQGLAVYFASERQRGKWHNKSETKRCLLLRYPWLAGETTVADLR